MSHYKLALLCHYKCIRESCGQSVTQISNYKASLSNKECINKMKEVQQLLFDIFYVFKIQFEINKQRLKRYKKYHAMFQMQHSIFVNITLQ